MEVQRGQTQVGGDGEPQGDVGALQNPALPVPACWSLTTGHEVRARFTRKKGDIETSSIKPNEDRFLLRKLKCFCRQKTFSLKRLCQYATWAQRKEFVWMYVNTISVTVIQTGGDSCVSARAACIPACPDASWKPDHSISTSPFPGTNKKRKLWDCLLLSGFLGQEEFDFIFVLFHL